MAVEHPAKIHALVNTLREADDLRIGREALPHSQHTGEQQCRIDRRDFAVPAPLAGLRVEPVIKPAALVISARVEEAQRVARAFERFIA